MMKVDKNLKAEDKARKENCEAAIEILEQANSIAPWEGFGKHLPKNILVRGGGGQVHVGDVFRGVFPTLEYCRRAGIKLVLASSAGLHKSFSEWSDTLKILDASQTPENLAEQIRNEGVTEVTKWGHLHREWRRIKNADELKVIPDAPFIQPAHEQVLELRKDYGGTGERRILGIIWRTSMIGRKGGRDSSLSDFGPLLTLNSREWSVVSLQYGDMDRTEDEIRNFTRETGLKLIFDRSVNPMKDYVAASAQMAACDHIVSIDCSQIFQAGAGAVPVSVLLPHETAKQWEEFADKDHPNRCPFFPDTGRLYRQKAEDDWSHPIEKAKEKLLRRAQKTQVWSHKSALWIKDGVGDLKIA